MADGNADDHMSDVPSRTVEVTLDAESEALLMARGPDFRLNGVKERFREHFRPQIAAELATSPGVKWLKFAASVVAGALRLIRR
ncbi:MAG: hypothetical protein B7Z37_12920 [Verrucomicrobia bacterium 12-59-8]|nr:MAG: hypothetical protein B7Z37_12920 [Verrucomicrobia bacterium 12-59-8]